MKPHVIGSLTALAFSTLVSAGFAQETLLDELDSADIAKGERVFSKCKACHTIEKDGKNKVGPNLYGIVGQPVAEADGFKFSKALTEFGGTWTLGRLDAFLERPRAAVKGTRMSFAGVKNPADRLDLLAYLSLQSDVRAGAVSSSEPAGDGTAADSELPEFGILFLASGVEETFYTCTACHSERIVAQQGLTRSHWEEVLVWMVEEQEMDEIEEPDRTIILDYLALHYGEDRPNFPKLGN
ncbi:MAG TPA: cytochrome C [Octadecabacter sp.]|nr:cytochrome C [Octadecabacter sp.]